MLKVQFESTTYKRVLSFTTEKRGTYSSVEINVSARFNRYINKIAQIIETVIVTGYSWLFKFIRDKFSSLETALTTELYSYLQMIFDEILKPGLIKNIWLAVANKERGFYVLDKLAVERATITLVTNVTRETMFSPAQLLAQFLTTVLPYELMHCKLAISTGKCIDIDLRTSMYLKDEIAYEIAEEIMFGSKTICAFPIALQGNKYLLAAFPRKMKDDILPVLEKHIPNLEKIFNENKNKAQIIWNELREKSINFPILQAGGEFIGSVLTGVLKKSLEP